MAKKAERFSSPGPSAQETEGGGGDSCNPEGKAQVGARVEGPLQEEVKLGGGAGAAQLGRVGFSVVLGRQCSLETAAELARTHTNWSLSSECVNVLAPQGGRQRGYFCAASLLWVPLELSYRTSFVFLFNRPLPLSAPSREGGRSK